jgi:hypothetical protein
MKFLAKHSAAINTIAAIVVAFATVVGVYEQPPIKALFQRADLRVEYSIVPGTVPHGFIISTQTLLRDVQQLLDPPKVTPKRVKSTNSFIKGFDTADQNAVSVTQAIRGELNLPALQGVRRAFSNEYQTWTIRVNNQTDRSLSVLRVNFGETYWLWDADVAGTFLTSDEKDALVTKIRSVKFRQDTFEIASLPPKDTIIIAIYGSFSSSPSLSVSAPNATSSVENISGNTQGIFGGSFWMAAALFMSVLLLVREMLGVLIAHAATG